MNECYLFKMNVFGRRALEILWILMIMRTTAMEAEEEVS